MQDLTAAKQRRRFASAHRSRSRICDSRPAVMRSRHCPHSPAGRGLFRELEECQSVCQTTHSLQNYTKAKEGVTPEKLPDWAESVESGNPLPVHAPPQSNTFTENQQAVKRNPQHRFNPSQLTSRRPLYLSHFFLVVNSEENRRHLSAVTSSVLSASCV